MKALAHCRVGVQRGGVLKLDSVSHLQTVLDRVPPTGWPCLRSLAAPRINETQYPCVHTCSQIQSTMDIQLVKGIADLGTDMEFDYFRKRLG